MGIFTETAGQHVALTLLAELLRSDVPGSMRALARVYGAEHYRAWSDRRGSIQPGEPTFPRAFASSYFEYHDTLPELWAHILTLEMARDYRSTPYG